MDEIAAPLKEILENSRTILNRCNELCEDTSTQCSCKSALEVAQQDISGLQTKCTALENKRTEQINAMNEMSNNIKGLKDKIESLMRDSVVDDREVTIKQTDKREEVRPVISSDSAAHFVQNKELSGHRTKQEFKPTSYQEAKIAETSSESSPEYSVYHVTSTTSDISSTVKHERKVTELTEACVDKVAAKKQEAKVVPDGEKYWRELSQMELNESQTTFADLEGVHSVLCLDISESMLRNNGWEHASTFVKEYLQGLKEMSDTRGVTNEYVAMVTFGHETVVKQRYTNKYDELLEVLSNLKLGGPSPLLGGMLMSLAAAWCSNHRTVQVGCGTHVGTRIIIISDGMSTDTALIAGPDTYTHLNKEETKNPILEEMDHYRNEHFDVFFVPVGNSDQSFFELMLGISEGVMIDHKSGRRLARRHFLSTKIVDVLGLMSLPLPLLSTIDLSEEDKADMKSIQDRTKKLLFSGGMDVMKRTLPDYFHERQQSKLPAVGSRVRRGPDWQWNEQDSSGPGTVIGHDPNDDQVWVEWDTDKHRNIYRYGDIGFDVIIVDEPRKVSDKRSLDVGCNVQPGENWKATDRKHKSGIVIKLDKSHKKATVRWDNGRRGEYSYDAKTEEIVYSPPFEAFSSEGYTLGYTMEESSSETNVMDRRNKNKNINPK